MGEVVEFPVPVADPETLAWKELNDLGNAERLIERFRDRLCFVDGRWMAWTGTHWSAEEGQQIAVRAAHEVSKAMREEYAALKKQIDENRLRAHVSRDMAVKRLEDLFKHSKSSGNANKTAAMLTQAQALVARRRDDFDADAYLLNCLNCTVRFVRGGDGRWGVRHAPHDPEQLLSRITAAEYDPAATCPTWDAHLAVVLPDANVRAFFQAAIGYSLLGLTIEQAMLVLQGRGGDGKSTTMDAIRQMMGSYAMTADVKTFLAGAARSGADASPDLARLAGDVRLCTTSEPKRGQALDEALIKSVTGGSPIAARELNQPLFEYVPRFKLFLECNAKPRISGDDDGIWRRVLVVLFPHQFKGSDIDKRAKDRLLEELPGILNWAIAGALAWLDEGQLRPPQAVLEAVEDYRRSANPFGNWLAERVDTSDATALVESSALFADYEDWCTSEGIGDREKLSQTAFGKMLGDRQILKRGKDSRGRILRVGARLRSDSDLAGRSGPRAPGQSESIDSMANRPFAPPVEDE